MWQNCLILSFASIALAAIAAKIINLVRGNGRKKLSVFHAMFAGAFLAAVFMFFPIHSYATDGGVFRAIELSLFNAMQLFAMGAEFSLVFESIGGCPEQISVLYQVWAAVIYVLAPIFTFGFVLSLFKNITSYVRYLRNYFRDVYVFAELNDKSLALAEDIKKSNRKAAVVFADAYDEEDESCYDRLTRAGLFGAICFKKDITSIAFGHHSSKRSVSFFAIGEDESQNLDTSISLIEAYRDRKNTHIYVFSTKIESELVLTSVDKGEIKVRRINEVQSLINRILFERGNELFETARESEDGVRDIGAVVVGMGRHGTEMVKALAWYGQMDGYRITVDAFELSKDAESFFKSLAPELMSDEYNGVSVPGEAEYKINIHSGIDVQSFEFDEKISALKNATYVFVALGNDDVNIQAAVKLRMLFERKGLKPVIQAVVYNTKKKNALGGIKNYRGQPYAIEFLGDLESSYSEKVIIDSELEEEALARHLKWGNEDEFWTYEYNYRSSVASAIHLHARIYCGIAGADKDEADLTEEERRQIETVEHRRWNAYMRAEGYVYSGSDDSKSRNDLAKMHHNLVKYDRLSDDDKRKDSRVGTK